MNEIMFFDWKVCLQDNLIAVTDLPLKKMVLMESALDLHAVLWIDEQNKMQIKPAWDCVISINAEDKTLIIRHVDNVFKAEEE